MQITHENGLYFVSCEYEQREIPRRLGFRWHEETKRWFTNNWYVAHSLGCSKVDNVVPTSLRNYAANVVASYNQQGSGVIRASHLFPYQQAGVELLRERENVLLADEQGLGKTLQVIEYLNTISVHAAKKILILCPASLKLNWKREILKWGNPGTYGIKIIQTGRDTLRGADIITGQSPNVIICNYDLIASKFLFDQLVGFTPDVLVCDEAHYLKNSTAKRTKTVKKIAAVSAKKIFLTGTPMLNRPIELHSILTMISPETIAPFEGYREYARRFCAGHQGRWGYDATGASNLPELGMRLRATCMVRRTKAEVLKQLPEKTLQIIPFEQCPKTKKLIERESDFSFDDLKGSPQRATIGDLAEIRHKIALTKIEESARYISDMMESVDKLVIFAYHQDVIIGLAEKLAEFKPVKFSGHTPQKQRQEYVDAFQNDPSVRIFIGQIQAAGTGLTLTAANNVVFVETTWVPGEIHQAIDRCHRIGQNATSVTAKFLVVEGSLDEAMLKRIVDKAKIINKVMA